MVKSPVVCYGNDMVAKLSQTQPDDDDAGTTAVVAKSFTLDPAERLSSTEEIFGGTALRQTVNHYSDGGDAPAWITEKTKETSSSAWAEAWTRNVLGPDGDLAIIAPDSGTAKIQITNLHGDVVTAIDNTTGVPVIDAYVESTEYGKARTEGANLGQHYGWLGGKRRSTDSLGGLTLMGVRLYNPTTGRFASMDPVYGGNDNTYTYPVDPINQMDTDGKWPKWVKKAAKKVRKSAVVIGTTVCTACGVVYGGYRTIKAYKKGGLKAAAREAVNMVPGGAGRAAKLLGKHALKKASKLKKTKDRAKKAKKKATQKTYRKKAANYRKIGNHLVRRSGRYGHAVGGTQAAYEIYRIWR